MMIHDERNFEMIYKTVTLDYAPKTKKMAAIEEKAEDDTISVAEAADE